MIKKIGLDLGNSTIKIAAKKEADIFKCYIPSAVNFMSGDNSLSISDSVAVVSVEGKGDIILGQGMPLVSIDKTQRGYFEHQVLYAAYKAYGPGAHVIEIATGLPLVLYKRKQEEYLKQLQEIDKISGVVNGEAITVNIQKVLVKAEGHSSFQSLKQKVSKVTPVLLIDIGYKTVESILFRWDDSRRKFVIEGNEGYMGCALYDFYKMLSERMAQLGGDYTREEIDKRLHSNNPIFRMSDGSTINLQRRLDLANDSYDVLIRNLENTYGPLYQFDLLFTGGGSELFLDGTGDRLKNVISISNEEKYYSNALGYLAALGE